jgi:hypothetical protein
MPADRLIIGLIRGQGGAQPEDEEQEHDPVDNSGSVGTTVRSRCS